MTFYVAAENDCRRAWIARQIEARDFFAAYLALHELAAERWPGERWHATSVTEQPTEPSLRLEMFFTGARAA